MRIVTSTDGKWMRAEVVGGNGRTLYVTRFRNEKSLNWEQRKAIADVLVARCEGYIAGVNAMRP